MLLLWSNTTCTKGQYTCVIQNCTCSRKSSYYCKHLPESFGATMYSISIVMLCRLFQGATGPGSGAADQGDPAAAGWEHTAALLPGSPWRYHHLVAGDRRGDQLLHYECTGHTPHQVAVELKKGLRFAFNYKYLVLNGFDVVFCLLQSVTCLLQSCKALVRVMNNASVLYW